MMNFLAKSLVLFHTVLSVAAMAWAVATVLQWKDFGRMEPNKEVLEYSKEGEPKLAVRHASMYDKSTAALTEAGQTRDRTFVYVKPAIESIQAKESFLPQNHLFYIKQLKRLRDEPDPIEVKRLKDGGVVFDSGYLDKPAFEDKAVDNVGKSYRVYWDELKKVAGHKAPGKDFEPGEIGKVEAEIQDIVNKTKIITQELTGTDEANKYVQPGLYKLIDLEFKFQTEIKNEIDDIKPNESKSIEQSRLYQYRRADLEATLQKLKVAAPAKK